MPRPSPFATCLLLAALAFRPELARAEDAPDDDSPENTDIEVVVKKKVITKNFKGTSSFSVALGMTHIDYHETGYTDLNELALTPKVSYRILLPWPRMDLGGTSFMTASALSTNQPGVVARFLGVNVRVGYGTTLLPEPWRLSVMAGGYYTTMLVSGAAFGFSGLAGPQIFPSLRYSLKSGDVLSLSFKLCPIGTFFSLSDRELAAGVAWTRMLAESHPLTASLDLSDLRFTNQGSEAVSKSATVSVGFGW